MQTRNKHIRNSFYTVISDIKYPLSDDNSTIDSYEVGIVNIADYSPFGVQLDGRTFENDFYRRSFQNQEHHDEIKGKGNYMNYKYRGYDPRIGRLDWTLDPLKDSYPHNSPYAFSENVVINAVELEGLERSYTFNSADLSAKALTVIQAQSYAHIKRYLNEMAGTKFNSYKDLKEAKNKLGNDFDISSGYSGTQGTIPLNSGDNAVNANYESENSENSHIIVRLIDNDNGKWNRYKLKIRNSEFIKNGLAKVNTDIKKVKGEIKVLKSQKENLLNWINQPTDKLINTSDLHDGRADAFFNLGQTIAKEIFRRKDIPRMDLKIKELESKLRSLNNEKRYLESESKKPKIERIN